MGVTNRNEVHYHKNPDSLSSTESLHIPGSTSASSVTSLDSIEPVRVVQRPKRLTNPKVSPLGLPRHAGRRRIRRYKAICELEALIEEEEPEFEPMPHKSAFTVLLENPDLEPIWDRFIEEDENSLLNEDKGKPKSSKLMPGYSNISLRIKMKFKKMRDICELRQQECEIRNFFAVNPLATYVQDNKNSYQRLLIHGLAQYYCFRSTSYNNNGKRVIKVQYNMDIDMLGVIFLHEKILENRGTIYQ